MRRELAGDDSLPRYLLAPEVAVLLAAVPDLHRRILFEFIWNTGARINEALAIRPDDIVLDRVRPHARLVMLKRQRNPKPGNPPAGHGRYGAKLAERGGDEERRAGVVALAAEPYPIHAETQLCDASTLCGIMPTVLQGWLGHADFRNTQIYIHVLHTEAAASRLVSFGMTPSEAAGLLRL